MKLSPHTTWFGIAAWTERARLGTGRPTWTTGGVFHWTAATMGCGPMPGKPQWYRKVTAEEFEACDATFTVSSKGNESIRPRVGAARAAVAATTAATSDSTVILRLTERRCGVRVFRISRTDT